MQGLLCSISVFEYQNACIFHLVMLEATNSAASDRLEELMLAQYDHSTHRNRPWLRCEPKCQATFTHSTAFQY